MNPRPSALPTSPDSMDAAYDLLCLWLDRETAMLSMTAILETFFLRRRNARIFSDWVCGPIWDILCRG